MATLFIRRTNDYSSIESDVPLPEIQLLTILLDSVLHVSAKIARTHNCQDTNCELQSFASKVNNLITSGLEKEIKFYGPTGADGAGTNTPQTPQSGPSGPTLGDINSQLDKWLNDIHKAESNSEGNTGP